MDKSDWTPRTFDKGEFVHVKVGDVVTRMLAGTAPMYLKVTEVTDELIVCGVPGAPEAEGWTFDRSTGAEVDHELQWGPQYGATGSFLVKETDETH